MPVYQYHCPRCGVFDKLNPMDKAREQTPCPACGQASDRRIAAPFLASSARLSILASAKNELAQNEPKHSSQLKHKHGPTCGCSGSCAGRITGKTASDAAGKKMFPTKRPWMISH